MKILNKKRPRKGSWKFKKVNVAPTAILCDSKLTFGQTCQDSILHKILFATPDITSSVHSPNKLGPRINLVNLIWIKMRFKFDSWSSQKHSPPNYVQSYLCNRRKALFRECFSATFQTLIILIVITTIKMPHTV